MPICDDDQTEKSTFAPEVDKEWKTRFDKTGSFSIDKAFDMNTFHLVQHQVIVMCYFQKNIKWCDCNLLFFRLYHIENFVVSLLDEAIWILLVFMPGLIISLDTLICQCCLQLRVYNSCNSNTVQWSILYVCSSPLVMLGVLFNNVCILV